MDGKKILKSSLWSQKIFLYKFVIHLDDERNDEKWRVWCQVEERWAFSHGYQSNPPKILHRIQNFVIPIDFDEPIEKVPETKIKLILIWIISRAWYKLPDKKIDDFINWIGNIDPTLSKNFDYYSTLVIFLFSCVRFINNRIDYSDWWHGVETNL
jgi:hypothetical protein